MGRIELKRSRKQRKMINYSNMSIARPSRHQGNAIQGINSKAKKPKKSWKVEKEEFVLNQF